MKKLTYEHVLLIKSAIMLIIAIVFWFLGDGRALGALVVSITMLVAYLIIIFTERYKIRLSIKFSIEQKKSPAIPA